MTCRKPYSDPFPRSFDPRRSSRRVLFFARAAPRDDGPSLTVSKEATTYTESISCNPASAFFSTFFNSSGPVAADVEHLERGVSREGLGERGEALFAEPAERHVELRQHGVGEAIGDGNHAKATEIVPRE